MKKTVCLLLALLLCLPLAACAGHIEDTNGDDPTPVTLTDADIVKFSTSSIASSFVSNTVNGKTTTRVGKLSGVTQLAELHSDGREVLTYTASRSEGNLRLCLVRDGKIVSELPVDGEAHTVPLPDTGKYQLRAAGESAKFNIVYEKQDWPADWDVND